MRLHHHESCLARVLCKIAPNIQISAAALLSCQLMNKLVGAKCMFKYSLVFPDESWQKRINSVANVMVFQRLIACSKCLDIRCSLVKQDSMVGQR